MKIEHLAVVVHGTLTLIFLLVTALYRDALLGLMLALGAAALTYVFQVIELVTEDQEEMPPVQLVLWLLIVILCVGSAIASLFGA